MNILESLNKGLETKYHLNEAKEDKERFLSFINATIKNDVKSQSIVDNFDKLKSSGRIKGEEADYYYWIKNKTVNELRDFLNAFNSTLSKTQTKKQEKDGAELIPCPNKNWVIYKINTYDASKYYGENTHWCITGRNGSDGIGAFNNYKQLGVKDYYFLWKIGNEKNGKWCYLDYGEPLQVNDDYFDDCFWDAQDDAHKIEDVNIPNNVLLSLPGISQKTLDDAQKEKDRKLKQKKVKADVHRTGVYTYDPLDNNDFIQDLHPKKIIVPDSVKKIEDYAFFHCGSLEEIILHTSIKEIGDRAFSNCASLQKINIPNNVERIGDRVFKDCLDLKEVNLPSSVKEIGECAFEYCMVLKKINIPDGIKEIQWGTFSDCSSLKEINISNSVEKIGNHAFEGCVSLQEIIIPDNVKEIGDKAFSTCVSLQEINISNSVEKIGGCTFYKCRSLYEITLPYSIKRIGERAFDACTSLQEINIKGEYRPQIFEDTSLNKKTILNWIDCGIKETWGQ